MSLAPLDFEYLRTLVKRHTAIVVDPGKEYLAETRLASLVSEHGCASLQDLLARLRRDSFGGLHRQVLDAMTNNETWFFRDAHPFAALTGAIIPELMRRRAARREIAIWSAACSSGQEPYSIAMALRENFNLANWKFTITATDYCSTVLERARTGVYRQMEVNRGLSAQLLTRYFTQQGLHWQLKPEVRGVVSFRHLNLAEPWGNVVPPADVVFLRNVLIYFDVEMRKAILARVRRVLAPDGYLLLGCAETTLNLDSEFERVPAGNYVCYKIKER
jgi:chemotaxis protein methyltransferase CheR